MMYPPPLPARRYRARRRGQGQQVPTNIWILRASLCETNRRNCSVRATHMRSIVALVVYMLLVSNSAVRSFALWHGRYLAIGRVGSDNRQHQQRRGRRPVGATAQPREGCDGRTVSAPPNMHPDSRASPHTRAPTRATWACLRAKRRVRYDRTIQKQGAQPVFFTGWRAAPPAPGRVSDTKRRQQRLCRGGPARQTGSLKKL